MYKELFEKNKEAIVFLQKEENLSDHEVNSIAPIRHTKLNVKTIVGIADLMTRFAESKVNDVSTENKALHIDSVMCSCFNEVLAEVWNFESFTHLESWLKEKIKAITP